MKSGSLALAVFLLLGMATCRARTETEVETEVELEGEEIVDRNNSHCNWTVSMGPICIFNNTDKLVVIPKGLMLHAGQMEIEVHQAKALHVYPTCVSWIQVFSVGLITTLGDSEEGCRTWLRIYDSQVETVSHGVKDLTLINSHANLIMLQNQRDFMAVNSTIKAIGALDWIGYRGTIQNSQLEFVSNVEANDNLWIIGSHIGHISYDGIVFNAAELIITNTTIGRVSSQGLKIKRGAVTISNVTIDYLDESAINVTSSEGFLSLNNITITYAVASAIVLADRERISLKNVTVDGVLLNMSSSYLQFLEDDYTPGKNVSVQLGEDVEGCEVEDNTLFCNFTDLDKPVEVFAENIRGFSEVKVRNARSLQVFSAPCDQTLDLDYIQGGSVAPLQSVEAAEGDAGGRQACDVTLVLRNSELDKIDCAFVTAVELTNSTVKRLHGGTLKTLNLRNVAVNQLDNLNITDEGSQWQVVDFHTMVNVTFMSPVEVNDIHVGVRIHQIEFDHEGATSTFSKIRLASLLRQSILLRRGNVTFNSILTVVISEGAVRLEEGTYLELTNFWSVLRSFRVISVASRDQVVVKTSSQLSWIDMLLHVRLPPPSSVAEAYTINSSVFSAYCMKHTLMIQVCSFADYPGAEVNLDMPRREEVFRTLIHSAAKVNIFPCCIEKLILRNVTSASTYDGEAPCATWLEATNVTFENITTGVNDVTLHNCTVELLATDHKLRDIDLFNTRVRRIRGIHWEGYTGIFNNSRLDEVEGLLASSRMMMSETHVGVLLHDGLTIAADAVIANSTIGEVHKGGITVMGMLNIQDVTIASLAEGAIVVTKGLLLFENVTIEAAERESIVALRGGGVAFRNVSVGGKRVTWTGYLADADASNHSVVFVNEERDGGQGGKATTAEAPRSTPPESTKPATPARRPASTPPARPDEKSESLGSQEKAISLEESSWKWAGAGVGFFIGLLAGGCILFVVKVLKPNKGMLSLPTVFWRVKDDQHGLLNEDASPEVPEQVRDSGYRSVPASDVL
ncbi:uncharacterized protein [Penaeus vannamei]|uniref:uncharacterized protein n=1 Tax=Penaeus vannamei TaxID=6689 RepID=UPI00387F9509